VCVRRKRWRVLVVELLSIFRILRVLFSASRTCMSLVSLVRPRGIPPSPYVLSSALRLSVLRTSESCVPVHLIFLFYFLLLPYRSLMWGEKNCSRFLPRHFRLWFPPFLLARLSSVSRELIGSNTPPFPTPGPRFQFSLLRHGFCDV
jgi:hypothetical protein